MSATKNIKNPEVPGLECLLPPPPPPPPPPNITVNESHPPPSQPGLPTPVPPPSGPFANVMTPGPYYPNIPPPVQTHSPSTPWWIPTDADSSDVYAQWYATSYKSGTPAVNSDPPVPPVDKSKSKNKFLKRKSETIDPRVDAEKVASAQRELSALMKPLKCDLCNAIMNSTLQAKRHYDGKPHQKKVSMFLNQSAKKLKADDGQVTSTTGNDWNSYCEICKTWFTSQMDAAQHYAGKKHIKATHGLSRPSQKKKSGNQLFKEPNDATGRFGIGMSFHRPEPTVPVVAVPVPVPVPVPEPPSVAPSLAPPVTPSLAPPVASPVVHYSQPVYPQTLHCDLCGVSANREDQLETHKRGARHLRMLKLNGLPVPECAQESQSISTATGPIDYSIYRTPSGQYYCAPCNLSLNSEITFAQHIESKKHKNQVNPKVQSTPSTPSKKSHKKK